jgi:hypothetical protein
MARRSTSPHHSVCSPASSVGGDEHHHLVRIDVAGQGSAGNVIAALCSFFVPGLGQLIQGRLVRAIVQFVLAGVLWFVLLGWVIHLWSVLDAALWKPRD